MKIRKIPLPEASVLRNITGKYVHIDSYSASINGVGTLINATGVANAFFFQKQPGWIGALFSIRNGIVKYFGLKTGTKEGDIIPSPEGFKFEVGKRVGLFKVFANTASEIIGGEDDKHLNFRISLFTNHQPSGEVLIVVSTVVQFNNLLGRLYFIPVRLFHGLITRSMLKSTAEGLEKKRGFRDKATSPIVET
jgi:hypothetical protein